jgi:hypothetical protein
MTISIQCESDPVPETSGQVALGAIIQFRPTLQSVVSIPAADFDRVWWLAVGGGLKYCYLAFTEPYRRHSLIVRASFSNRSDDESEDSSTSQPDLLASLPERHDEARGIATSPSNPVDPKG